MSDMNDPIDAEEPIQPPMQEGEGAPAETLASRPAEVPEKFWDSATGTTRVEALLGSYLELERKLGSMLPVPTGPDDHAARERLLAALGRPPQPDDYRIAAGHPVLEADPEVNARLHQAGFTEEQAQLVYDIAAEYLVPAIESLAEESRARRDTERLEQQFGGPQAWRQTAQQIKTWGEAHLDPGVLATLSGSIGGVQAMHEMMRASEPELVGTADAAAGRLDEASLNQMMRDPRYWRDRDPEFIARVTRGFKQLYPD